MKRLVYSPKVYAYISTVTGEIIDISDYIVRGNVRRVVNEVSTAEITIRNPGRQFTSPGNPTFRPMDRITIYMSRFQNLPVQVFVGYLDKTPYMQLTPGTCTITASCTLKRLLHTYWDAGVPFSLNWLRSHGWIADPASGQVTNQQAQSATQQDTGTAAPGDDPNATNPLLPLKDDLSNLSDSGFGQLIVAAMNEIGNWEKDTILVEDIRPEMVTAVTNYLDRIIGADTVTPDTSDPAKDDGSVTGKSTPIPNVAGHGHGGNG